MRNTLTFAFILLLGLAFTSCENDAANSADDAANPAPVTTQPVTPNATQPAANQPAANNSGVEHYICPNGHVGSGGPSAGNCSQCGTALTHNQAYHSQNQPAINPATNSGTNPGTNASSPLFQNTPGAAGNTPSITPQTSSPAQNANGVWHYTCSKGCAGGSGSKGNCANCGAELAHNQAYHN